MRAHHCSDLKPHACSCISTCCMHTELHLPQPSATPEASPKPPLNSPTFPQQVKLPNPKP